jgi:hypothetical protein
MPEDEELAKKMVERLVTDVFNLLKPYVDSKVDSGVERTSSW